MMPIPNFFIVGAPKCGTTAMYEYLRAHPDIFMPETVKEPHYFAQKYQTFRMRQYRSLEAYLSLFEAATVEKRLGEASVLYLYAEDAAQQIYDFNPDAQIIAMLRNPAEMLYSLFYQERYGGNEVLDSFEEALDLEAERKQGKHIPARSTPEKLYYREIGKYGEQLQRYIDCFGRDQIHVIIFDDFRADTEPVYRETLNFLQVDPDFGVELVRINENKVARFSRLNRFINRPPQWYANLREVARKGVPMRIRSAANNGIRAINLKREPRPPMRPETRQYLQNYFQPDIDALSAMLGRDLSQWYKQT